MRTSHLPLRMNWLVPICCVVLALLLAMPSTVSAATIFATTLTGANEVPPTGSPATGSSIVTLNGNILSVNETFSGLIGGSAAAAHIHCCVPAGVNAAVAVPFTGSYDPVVKEKGEPPWREPTRREAPVDREQEEH